MRHLPEQDSFYLVARHVCMNCHGAGYHPNPTTGNKPCSDCGGVGVTDEVEPVYLEEFLSMKAQLDPERDRPSAWRGMESGPISVPSVAEWKRRPASRLYFEPGVMREVAPGEWMPARPLNARGFFWRLWAGWQVLRGACGVYWWG
jgi:hypothetical protein